MIINASGGNADAVMTVAQTLSDTQKTQARTNIGALSSANGAVAAKNLASNAVETAKIKDANVTRAKLANDALYSPLLGISANRNIASTDLGGTIYSVYNSTANDLTLTLTQTISATLPRGFEFAVGYFYTNNKIKVALTGVRVMISGEGQKGGASSTVTVRPSEVGQMIAFKRIDSASNGDYWIVTGAVEVVS